MVHTIVAVVSWSAPCDYGSPQVCAVADDGALIALVLLAAAGCVRIILL